MPRPRKRPEQRRARTVTIRLTDAELTDLKQHAMEAGMPYGQYAREAALGRTPRPRAADDRVMQALLYELTSIATNLNQLAKTTGDKALADWASYAGGQIVERLHDRRELAPLIQVQLERLNTVGLEINAMAHQANMERLPDRKSVDAVLRKLETATRPLHRALEGDFAQEPADDVESGE